MTTIVSAPPTAAPESSQSAISWAAVIAGAVVALAVSLSLLVLGSGLGFAAATPWADLGTVAGTLAASAAIWLVVVQWLAAAIGGYITGRLRTRWVGVHTDEVFFRDTAHGFLAWCLSTILAAALLGSLAIGTVSTGVKATAAVGTAAGATAVAAGANGGDATGYLVDTLFRPIPDQLPPATPAAGNVADARAEALRIVVASVANGGMSDGDKAYLARLVAGRTGLPAADAEKRVNDLIAAMETAKQKAADAADTARKAATTTMLIGFLSLVIGAFISAVAAALAGRLRDEDVPTTG